MRNAHSPSKRADTFAGVRRRAWLASTGLTVAALATPALADTDWNSGTGNWATNASWTNNAPTAATNITNVSNGNIAQISTAAVAGTNFGSGAHLNVTNGSTVMLLANGSLAVGGFANFNNGTLSLFGSTNVTGGISLANSTISSNVDGTLTSDIASVNGDNRIVAANGTMLTLAPSLAFGVQNASTLHFGTTNNFGTITFEGASNLVTSNTASIAIDGGILLSSQTPTNHGLEDLTSSVASVTVAFGGLLGYRGNLRPDSVTIRDLQGAGTVAVAEGGTGMLGISQGNFSGQIMTADGLRVIGGSSGTLILTGDQTYTGGTVIDADHILQLGDTTATGSIIGDVVNNGRLKFARSATYSFDGVISGSGVVELRNGEVALTGTNTYQGGTVIRGGTLVVSRDENLGAASGSITFGGDFAGMKFADNFTSNRGIESNGTIAAGFDTNGHNVTLGGVISGPGGLIKDGLGTLTLTNTSTYEGFTEVVKGMLRVNGSIASSHVTVDPDAWLGGTGTVGATDVYGVLSPGNSIGTLTVNGALAFKAGSGSVYFVEMSPTSADRTNATGALTIENSASVNIVHQDGNYVAKRYTIIGAASRTGTFDSLAFIGGDNFGRLVTNPHLEYDATHVYFVLDPAKLTALLPTGATQNQSNLGNAVDRVYGAGGSSPVVGLFGATGSALVNGLAQASGETATGMQQVGFQSTNYFLTLMLDPFAPTRAGGTFGPAIGYAPEPASPHPEIAQAYAAAMPTKTPFEQRWSMWAAGYGGQARIQGDANVLGSHDTTARAFGVAGAPITRCRPIPRSASRSPVVPRIGGSPATSAPARATHSRPVLTRPPAPARPISRRLRPTRCTGPRPTAP
jgi:autotransporter-associated beta strand protein